MTNQQKLFAREYLAEAKPDAEAAAIRAGYSENYARETGARLLNTPEVVLYISQLMDERASRLELSGDMVIQEIAKMAFSNMADYVKWNADDVILIDSADLTRQQTAAVSEVSITPSKYGDSIKFKLHSKEKNLELLARHLKLLGIDNNPNDDDYVDPVSVNITAVDASVGD